MSKQNKVNKNNYDQAGRLTPDDLARERIAQTQISRRGSGKEHVIGKTAKPGGARASSPRRSAREG